MGSQYEFRRRRCSSLMPRGPVEVGGKQAFRACEKIAVVQAFRPAVSGGPNRLRQGYGGPPTSLRQGYGGPPKHLRRRKLYAEAEGPHYTRSDFFTGSSGLPRQADLPPSRSATANLAVAKRGPDGPQHVRSDFLRGAGTGFYDRDPEYQGFEDRAKGPTSGLPCVLASVPSSAATPRAIAAVSLPPWKHVKSGRSLQANGPHSRTRALTAAS